MYYLKNDNLEMLKGYSEQKIAKASAFAAEVLKEHDAGPWSASADGREISSDDFRHDVLLRVSGDFADDAQRKRYADNLVAKLNTPNVRAKRV